MLRFTRLPAAGHATVYATAQFSDIADATAHATATDISKVSDACAESRVSSNSPSSP